MSSFTVQWAAWAIARDARGQAYLALGITALMGVAFINQTSFLFKVAEVTLDQTGRPYFYAVTVGHLAMMVAALRHARRDGLQDPRRSVLVHLPRRPVGARHLLAGHGRRVRRDLDRGLRDEVRERHHDHPGIPAPLRTFRGQLVSPASSTASPPSPPRSGRSTTPSGATVRSTPSSGPLTLGYKGGVGEHVGYALLMGFGLVCLGWV